MENNIHTYGFWFWADKLDGILSMLAHLVDYKLAKEDLKAVRHGLSVTNDEKGQWFGYTLKGEKHELAFKVAYDEEEGSDMIHIKIETSPALKERLEDLNLFQSLFRKLELDN